ncbi:MAG: SPFH/Band 7/PHB domain protein [Thermoplasmata archaeon]|nr:SPFH/Band 7/PHB domain protein [Thermoplasmata archaeon]MCI4358996.1 SPFH/Band 7/PHB domain protein [Thermoplasmata archaeon]
MVDPVWEFVGVLIAVLALFVILSRVLYQILPYQQGIVTTLGSYKRLLNPGLNRVSPLSQVVKIDLRTQVLEVPRQEVITKDNSPTNVDAIIYIKVVDAPKSLFQVQDYHVAVVALAQTTLRSVIGDMELDEVLYNRERINTRLRDILDESTDRWGVRVEAVEIKEVDPVGPVKAAMEEQTSAERQRRAAVLRADGEKRSAILVAEGNKRSRILQAEGVRQSKILEAEGGRVATILEAQGESQRLRILSLGAGTLDAKALTVISLDTIASLGDGQATKILFPFEFSRLMEGASEYLGTSRTVPDRSLNTMEELQKQVGTMDDILGPIPRQDELMTEIKTIEEEIKAETDASSAMVSRGGSGGLDTPAIPELDDAAPPSAPSRPSTTPSVGPSPPSTTAAGPGAPPPGSPPPDVDLSSLPKRKAPGP